MTPSASRKIPYQYIRSVLVVLSAAAVSGLGRILLPDWNIGSELAECNLVEVLSDWRAVPQASPIFAVYPQQRQPAPKVRAFLDFLVDQVGSLSSDTPQS